MEASSILNVFKLFHVIIFIISLKSVTDKIGLVKDILVIYGM